MSEKTSGHVCALVTILIWGTTFISTKLLLRAYDPLAIMTYRFVIAWVILFFLHPKPLLPKSLREELPFMAAGLTGLTLYFILENTALAYTLPPLWASLSRRPPCSRR